MSDEDEARRSEEIAAIYWGREGDFTDAQIKEALDWHSGEAEREEQRGGGQDDS